MNETINVIEPMKKVKLTIEVGTKPEKMDLTSGPTEAEFIFGLGTDGLTPFEYQLAKREVGDRFTLRIQRNDLCEMFQHLPIPPFNISGVKDELYVKTQILDVSPADSREIIKCLSQITACGGHGGGDCDCGCSCH